MVLLSLHNESIKIIDTKQTFKTVIMVLSTIMRIYKDQYDKLHKRQGLS